MEKKDIHIKLNEKLYQPMKTIRENTGMSVNSQVYKYIYMGLLKDGLVSIDDIKKSEDK